ncbi:MAG TPA: hypothetical protein VNR36_08140 [Pseudolysinimonas sp.]|nr:hypothetical protein [Pseudolysinimonas sp.]
MSTTNTPEQLCWGDRKYEIIDTPTLLDMEYATAPIEVETVEGEPELRGELAEPFKTLLGSEHEEPRPVSQHGRGSSYDRLEGMTGIEPA